LQKKGLPGRDWLNRGPKDAFLPKLTPGMSITQLSCYLKLSNLKNFENSYIFLYFFLALDRGL
jgi:hypothetical protein